MPDFLADQLVATVTEGLSNVVRHAQATEASIRIEQEGDRLLLTISDNGMGLPEAPKRSGGLSNMMWRAAELGGSCTVERNEPAGTRLSGTSRCSSRPAAAAGSAVGTPAVVAMTLDQPRRQRRRFGPA